MGEGGLNHEAGVVAWCVWGGGGGDKQVTRRSTHALVCTCSNVEAAPEILDEYTASLNLHA